MTVTRALRVGLLILIGATAGAVLWAASVASVARLTEDLCFDDLERYPGYGTFNSESSLWPPSYECRLFSNDVEPIVVQHRTAAIASFGATVAFPVFYIAAAALVVVHLRRPRPRGRPEPKAR